MVPLKEFYAEFAANAESDGVLSSEEIRLLREQFTGIIDNAVEKFKELQKITDLNFAAACTAGGTGNALSGAIKGITNQQAELLADQFNATRMTALDQLKVAMDSLNALNAIQANTGLTALR